MAACSRQLAVAVYDTVYAAGMTFPFPQREVRLLHDAGDGKSGEVNKSSGMAEDLWL